MANQVLKVENILMSTEIRCKHYYNELEQCGQHFLKCLYKKHSRLVCLGVTLNMPPSSVNKIIICRKLLFLASPSEIELSNTFYIYLIKEHKSLSSYFFNIPEPINVIWVECTNYTPKG
jgi:hypothetical protein